MKESPKMAAISLIGGWTEGWGYGSELSHEDRDPLEALMISADYPVFRNLPIEVPLYTKILDGRLFGLQTQAIEVK